MSFKSPKFAYPSIRFVLENADRPEEYRERTRRAPTYYPAPPVVWVPGFAGRLPRIIIGQWYPPQLGFPPAWVQVAARLRPTWIGLNPNRPIVLGSEEDTDTDTESRSGTAASISATAGDQTDALIDSRGTPLEEGEEEEPLTPSQVLPRELLPSQAGSETKAEDRPT